jgi:hypothetical protein
MNIYFQKNSEDKTMNNDVKHINDYVKHMTRHVKNMTVCRIFKMY